MADRKFVEGARIVAQDWDNDWWRGTIERVDHHDDNLPYHVEFTGGPNVGLTRWCRFDQVRPDDDDNDSLRAEIKRLRAALRALVGNDE